MPAFVAVWCCACLLLARVGGWSKLASRFPVSSAPSGERFSFATARIGVTSYSRVLTAIKSDRGLYLAVLAPWRVGHPAILIPWAEMLNPTAKRVLWMDWFDVQVFVPGAITLRVPAKFVQGKLPNA